MSVAEMLATVRTNRQKVWQRGKDLLDRAHSENRELTAAENRVWVDLNEDINAFDERIEELADLERRDREHSPGREKYERSFGGSRDQYRSTDKDLQALLHGELRSFEVPFTDWSLETRDLTVGTASAGGDTVPTGFVRKLNRFLVERSVILSTGVRVLDTPGGEDLEIPKSTAIGTAALTAEGASIAESDPAFSKITLKSYKYAQLLQVSRELAEDSGIDILDFIAEDAGIAIGQAVGTDLTVGDGASKPSGLITDSTSNVGATGQSGVPTADELIDLYFKLPVPYRSGAVWLFSDSGWQNVRKLKTTTNEYLIDDLSQTGEMRLLGKSVFVDPDVSDPALNAKSVVFFNPEQFVVRRVGQIKFERSDDFAFANDLISFRSILRIDGKLMQATASQVYTGAAS